MNSKRLKLMADYGGTVLWGIDAEDIGAIEPEKLPITEDLKTAIRAWADAYDETLNLDYPPDSGFARPSEQEAFEKQGMRLWRLLQEQLGTDWVVVYYNVFDGHRSV